MEKISERLLDQRLRNRTIETVEYLSQGDNSVKEMGFAEWVEMFFDWMPSYAGSPYPNTAMTNDEYKAVLLLSELMIELIKQTPKNMTIEEFLNTGWPSRIQPHAVSTLILMRSRGKFSEEVEEENPSILW